MKKLTIAALILGASTAAHAQSNVTVYGLVDLGLAHTSGKTTVERENHASRLGFKGSEDLGGGLAAIFQLETEILADTGAAKGVLFERQANVGFKGSFGTVYLGRTKNLVDGAQGRIEPFGADGVIGKVDEPMMRVGVSSSRVNNAITYNSNSINGFVASAQYVLSEVSGAKNGLDLLATYDNGPVSLHFGYELAAQTASTTISQPKMFVVGGAFKIDALKLTAGYARGDTNLVATGKYKAFLLGAIYTVGQGDFKAVLGKQKQETNAVASKETVREIGVGYDYHLSKRTDLYAYAGREKVTSATSYQTGISHKF